MIKRTVQNILIIGLFVIPCGLISGMTDSDISDSANDTNFGDCSAYRLTPFLIDGIPLETNREVNEEYDSNLVSNSLMAKFYNAPDGQTVENSREINMIQSYGDMPPQYYVSADEPAMSSTAESSGGQSDIDELRAAAQNPVASMISLPIQNTISFGAGENDDVVNVLALQPVIPFKLNDNWNLITRTIIPFVYQTETTILPGSGQPTAITDDAFGLGDINTTLFLSPAGRPDSNFVWGVGPVFVFPTATDSDLGTKKWSAGPSALALYFSDPWVIGGLVSQYWSFAGDGDRDDVSQFLFQPFLIYNFPNYYLSFQPQITANWEADSGQKWTVPLGLGIGKLFTVGGRPINADLQAYYNVERPDAAPRWSLQMTLTFLFPK